VIDAVDGLVDESVVQSDAPRGEEVGIRGHRRTFFLPFY
jgi:hypothetical protein